MLAARQCADCAPAMKSPVSGGGPAVQARPQPRRTWAAVDASRVAVRSRSRASPRHGEPKPPKDEAWQWPGGFSGSLVEDACLVGLCGLAVPLARRRRRQCPQAARGPLASRRPSKLRLAALGTELEESPTAVRGGGWDRAETEAAAGPRPSRAETEESSLPEFMGVPLSPDFLAVGLVYFAQGALGLAALAKPYLLKDSLHLPPAEASWLLSLTYWPWALKPVWGFIADTFPIFGSRRRAYLLLAGLLSALGWLGLASGVVEKELVLFFMMLGNFGIAFSDVVVDGLVVEKARDDERLMGGLQSYSWGCRGIGAALSAYFSGALLEAWGLQAVFSITAALPLLVALAAALIEEDGQAARDDAFGTDSKASPFDGIKEQMEQIWDVLRTPEILPPVLFIALWQMTPNSGTAMFYYFTNELQFTPEFLGRAQLAGCLASLAGIFMYNAWFAQLQVRSYLLRVNLAACALGMLPLLLITHANRSLGIPDQAFALGDDVVQTVAGELAHMPILVLAARLCPPGVEATFFALLMSLLNVAGMAATVTGAWLTDYFHVTETDFSNLTWLVVACNASSLVPLLLLGSVPDEPPTIQVGAGGQRKAASSST